MFGRVIKLCQSRRSSSRKEQSVPSDPSHTGYHSSGKTVAVEKPWETKIIEEKKGVPYDQTRFEGGKGGAQGIRSKPICSNSSQKGVSGGAGVSKQDGTTCDQEKKLPSTSRTNQSRP